MRADDLLRPAHDAVYRFPVQFAGFTAKLDTHAGQTGTVTVRGRRDIEVTLPENAIDGGWVRQEIAGMIAHRWACEYADGDGRWSKRVTVDPTLAGAVLITLADDPFDSAYQLRDGQIAEVHRTAGYTRFVISVHDREVTDDGRTIPSRFSVFHWSTGEDQGPEDQGPDAAPARRLLRADHYRDTYARVDDVYLPACREVTSATDAGLTTRRIDLRDHVLFTLGLE
jgi:hypothetical protein